MNTTKNYRKAESYFGSTEQIIAQLGRQDLNSLTRVRTSVYTKIMKNITFSAHEQAIERARQVAAKKHRTLNELFREWLEDLDAQTQENNVIDKLEALWGETNYLRVGKKLSREEMNER